MSEQHKMMPERERLARYVWRTMREEFTVCNIQKAGAPNDPVFNSCELTLTTEQAFNLRQFLESEAPDLVIEPSGGQFGGWTPEDIMVTMERDGKGK